ncbi:uncharacterized protein LTR77_002960 [Saxophila tyrrhenica]|uniref:Uncharacterized protein n=1 Tax=Saxophila tyrrhenica TaxID=1690608 RepID=A0AAV9PGX0_9PEZI|nr:hypothetical protein LTR77_002960 [Saxophila tyrrhenica]
MTDPRRPEYTGSNAFADSRGNKRPASRSPEPVQRQKQVRQNPPSGPTNGDPRQPARGLTSPQDKANTKSPDSRSSARDGLSSGRSTPQHPPKLSKPDAATTSGAATPTASMNGSLNPVVEALLDFTSQNAQHSALQASVRVRQQHYETTVKEYNAMKDQFKVFPAVQKSKTTARENSLKELKEAQQELADHVTSERGHMQKLAQVIGEAAKPQQPIINKEDFVSREMFNEMKKEMEELKKEISGVRAQHAGLKIDVGDVKNFNDTTVKSTVGQITRLQSSVGECNKSNKELDSKVLRLEASQRDVDRKVEALEQWKSETIETTSQLGTVRSDVKALQTANTKLFAWKPDADKVIGALSTLNTRVDAVAKQADSINEDVKALQSTRLPDNMDRETDQKLKERQAELEKRHGKTERDVERIGRLSAKSSEAATTALNKLHEMRATPNGQDSAHIKLKEDQVALESRQDGYDQTLGSLRKAVNKLSEDLGKLQAKVSISVTGRALQPGESVGPDGNNGDADGIYHAKRLSEQAVRTKDDQSEEDESGTQMAKAMLARFQGKQGSAPAGPEGQAGPSRPSSELYATRESVEELERQLDALRGIQEDGQDSMIQHIEDALGAIKTDMSELRTARETSVKEITVCKSDLSNVQARLQNVDFQLRQKVQTEVIDRLRHELQERAKGYTTIMDDLKKFKDQVMPMIHHQQVLVNQLQQQAQQPQQRQQQQQQQMRSSEGPRSHTPIHPQPAQSPITAQSPQLPNGRVPSPMVNGVQAPGVPMSHAHNPMQFMPQGAVQQLPPIQEQIIAQIQKMQMQLDQVVMISQHQKRRMDNLTTDEVVKCMLDQLANVWPHAKNYEASLFSIQKGCRELEERVTGMKTEMDGEIGKIDSALQNSRSAFEDLKADVKGLQASSGKRDEGLKASAEDVKKLSGDVRALQSFDLKKLEDDVSRIEERASKHEQNASRMHEALESLAELEAGFAEVRDSVANQQGHIEMLREFVES